MQLWAAADAGKTAEVIRLVAAGARIDSHDPKDVGLLARRSRRLRWHPDMHTRVRESHPSMIALRFTKRQGKATPRQSASWRALARI
jgi:hypothetical protein